MKISAFSGLAIIRYKVMPLSSKTEHLAHAAMIPAAIYVSVIFVSATANVYTGKQALGCYSVMITIGIVAHVAVCNFFLKAIDKYGMSYGF